MGSTSRVLITRPERDSGELRSLLEARGFEVVALPTIAIRPVEDDSELIDVLSRLEEVDWIAFTSRNAVESMVTAMKTLNRLLPQNVHVAAVGPRSADALREAGIRVTLVSEEASASGLAHAMTSMGMAGKRVVLPVGDRARRELPDALLAAGADVRVVTVYRTETARSETDHGAASALREGRIDAVALASPSAFEGLLTILGPDVSTLRRVRLVCIGPTTAAAVRDAGLIPAAVAEPHTAEGLSAALAILNSTETTHDSA